MNPLRSSLLSGAAALLLGSCMTMDVSPITGERRAYAYSWSQEVKMGQEADAQIIQEYGLLNDGALTGYVTAVGERVLAESHLRREGTKEQFRNTPFTFRVLDSPVVNAFALPGGYNYVTRGLLAHLQNEAQLAMVLGHEVGHVAARHASQQALKQTAGGLLVVGGAVLGEAVLGLPGQEIMNLGGSAAQLLFLSYSRDNERESDRLGVEYAARAGYAAGEGAAFFTTLKRLSDQAGGRIPNHLSSHPDPGERETDIQQRSDRFKEAGLAQTDVNAARYLQMIDGMVYGENPRQGFVRNGMFLHPDLKFQYPIAQGWGVMNQSSAVITYEPEQKAILQLAIASEANAAEAADVFGRQEGITVVDRQALQNGAVRLIADAKAQDGTEYRFFVYTKAQEGRIYRFIGQSLKAGFETYVPAFERSAFGLGVVTDAAVLNIQPVRLKVITTTRSATLANLLPSPLPMDIKAEDVAILNQRNLTDVIPVGTKLKVPVQN